VDGTPAFCFERSHTKRILTASSAFGNRKCARERGRRTTHYGWNDPPPDPLFVCGSGRANFGRSDFSGFLFGRITQKKRSHYGPCFSAIFFALAHMDPSIFFPSFDGTGIRFTIPTMAEIISTFILMPIYFALGMLLGFAFLRTKSLYPGIVFHMVNNNAALILLLMSLKNNS
jgi:hypothetical protein